MSDVRRVDLENVGGYARRWFGEWSQTEDGTHALLPWEDYEKLHDLIEASDKEIVDQAATIGRLRLALSLALNDLRGCGEYPLDADGHEVLKSRWRQLRELENSDE